MEENTVTKVLLFDFYGELLTDKQKEYFDLRYNEDYSLAEIAELGGLSRQGVWDILRRAEETMRRMEEKTGIVRRYLERRAQIASIRRELDGLLPENEETRAILARLDGLL